MGTLWGGRVTRVGRKSLPRKVIRGGSEQSTMMCSSVMQACVIMKLIILHAN